MSRVQNMLSAGEAFSCLWPRALCAFFATPALCCCQPTVSPGGPPRGLALAKQDMNCWPVLLVVSHPLHTNGHVGEQYLLCCVRVDVTPTAQWFCLATLPATTPSCSADWHSQDTNWGATCQCSPVDAGRSCLRPVIARSPSNGPGLALFETVCATAVATQLVPQLLFW
jgi:hypothetical protein